MAAPPPPAAAAPAKAPPAAPAAAPPPAAAAPAPPPAAAAPAKDELPFQMKIEPDTGVLTFRAPTGGFVVSATSEQKNAVEVDLKLTNTTKSRQTFKVKCTNNDIFRVRPPLGFIKPDEALVIKLCFQPTAKYSAENKKHFFALYHFKTDDTAPVRQVWNATAKPEGVTRIMVAFENPDGTPIAPATAAPPAPAPAAAAAPPAPAAAPAAAAPPPAAAAEPKK